MHTGHTDPGQDSYVTAENTFLTIIIVIIMFYSVAIIQKCQVSFIVLLNYHSGDPWEGLYSEND